MTDPLRKLLFRLSDQKGGLAIASSIAIVLSWILLHVFYAFFYAHLY